jgi:hypothetical protein
MPPQAACRAAADHVRLGTQRFKQRLRPLQRVADEMARGVSAAAIDPFENVRLRFLAEPFQPGNLAIFAVLFELLDRFDSQLIVQGLDLLGSQSGDVEHRHESGWDRRLQVLVILQLPGGDEFGDLLLERIANAFGVGQARLGDHFVQRLTQGLNGAGGVEISPALERILTLQLQQRRNINQHFGYLILVHA